MSLAAVILAKNEVLHIRRAIESILGVVDHVLVVDSGSSDGTIEVAKSFGATVITNDWVNYATQFNFALKHLPSDVIWVLRLDADEIVSASLADEIASRLANIGEGIGGIYVSRRMNFLGQPVKFGGLFPVRVLRLFRAGEGRCENRWMDEHIVVEGPTADFRGEIVDDNLNSLTWWTEKHNSYASREVVDLLNLEYGFIDQDSIADLRSGRQSGVKRWLKEKVYARLPGGSRAFFYFLYRYIFRLGFLDGREGASFHVLQGFWYRYLVDTKLHEVKAYMRRNGVEPIVAIKDVLGIDVES